MKPFLTIAIPHKDVIEGKVTRDVFAADLWQVFKGRAPEEYQDSDIFFMKTYLTEGIKRLLSIVEGRLKEGKGAPVIQLQTPFGGGKTHTLIAIYHKSKEWKVNKIVFVGDKCDPKDIIVWEEMEKQLTGKIEKLKGETSPSVEKLRELFEPYEPLVILIDEIIEYLIPAAGITVGDSRLSTQILTFIRNLTETVRGLKNTILIFTYPSRTEYDTDGQTLLNLILERTGRVEEVYTPVYEDEIPSVIRRRLFTTIKEREAKEIIEKFLEYAEQEKILPKGVEKHIYRERFIKSYPFQLEVIDVLYKRWGSFPKFQRARGILYLLSLVINSIKDSRRPYIRLGDFNLKDERIREELVRYIGNEYYSVIFQDITSQEAGAKKIDNELGETYAPYLFGTTVATTIFMYSFSGGPERGATIEEIKLSSADFDSPSSIVVEALTKLSDPHYSIYLNKRYEKYFFTTEITLARILTTKIKIIEEKREILIKEEYNDLLKSFKKGYFEIYIWTKHFKDIPDTNRLKLVVLQNRDENKCKEFIKNYGERPRVNQNTIIFLCPSESERINYERFIKEKIAWQLIEKDNTLTLTTEQKKEVKERIKKLESESKENIRTLYRFVLVPLKDGFKEIDLGLPTYGWDRSIDEEIFDSLKSEGIILEKLSPLTIEDKYLKDKDYVKTKDILKSFYKTPGEIRILNEQVFKDAIKEGVKQGLFGLGRIENEKPTCHYFKKEVSPEIVEREIIIRKELCLPKGIDEEKFQKYITEIKGCKNAKELEEIEEKISIDDSLSPEQKDKLKDEIRKKEKELRVIPKDKYQYINLKLNVPWNKLSDIARIVNFIKNKFNQIDIKIEISSRDGEIEISEYEDKIKEAINQAGINVEIEEKR